MDNALLHVREYLKTHSLNQLKAEFGVNSSWKVPTYKFSLNYDQLESKAGPLTNQCRGLILATADGSNVDSLDAVVGETIVLARPMDRFFNYGDPNATNVNFDHVDTCYFEKLDGTLCILYFDRIKHEWHVATRGVPEANLPIDGFDDLTFRKLFEKALFETSGKTFDEFVTSDEFTDNTDNLTFCFELTSPYNRVVVDYKDSRLTLLAVRHRLDGHNINLHEMQNNQGTFCGLPIVKRHAIRNVTDLLEFVNTQNPTEHEGVVVCDSNHNRVKVKNAAYLAYNRARDIVGKSPRALLELILLEKIDDVLPMLPEHMKARSDEMQNSLVELVREIDQNYLVCKTIADKDTVNARKAFCLEAQAHKFWLEPLINRFLGKCDDSRSFFAQHKNPDGSYTDSFLDKILTQIKR